ETAARLFATLPANPWVEELRAGVEVGEEWVKDFLLQGAAYPERPGHVTVEVAPPVEGRKGLQPRILAHAVGIVAGVRDKAPLADVGVLVRTNKAAAYLIAALRQAGIPASGEGGTPLTDAAPVNAVLALLTLADHPAHTLARYHVATSPLGEELEYHDHADRAGSRALAHRVRRDLAREGYGRTVARWVGLLTGVPGRCSPREAGRLGQLVELAFRWDARADLRPGGFVRFVEEESVDEPSGARVRVMTIHQSKGLEFDVVVLPELHVGLNPRADRDAALPVREYGSGRVLRIHPRVPKEMAALFPEMREAGDQAWSAAFRDTLSALYVAMTRARFALHLVVPAEDGEKASTTATVARLVCQGLATEHPSDPGSRVYEDGDPEWYARLPRKDFKGAAREGRESSATGGAAAGAATAGTPTAATPAFGAPAPIRFLGTASERPRNVPRLSPSGMEGGSTVRVEEVLRKDLSGRARLLGTLVHAWCEAIGWIEDGLPDDSVLRRVGGRAAPAMAPTEMDAAMVEFRRWVEAPAVRDVLSVSRYTEGAEVMAELPFVRRVPDGIMQGFVDRVVVEEEDGRRVRAEVLDFKTDQVDAADPHAIAERAAYYAPQLQAYREAVAERFGLPQEAVTSALVFLRAGVVVS
ncbi:MAG: PD-(D/E)XK nuclease family protein, partial [Gemmatimonadota bacterium]|nr:PD-(D/E)XK nuclease family protein [Gemmatimonadota bacterium]